MHFIVVLKSCTEMPKNSHHGRNV